MPRKAMLPARLDPDQIARLNAVSKANSLSIDDTIALALDALEREQCVAETVTERLELLEKNLAALVDLIAEYSGKIDRQFGEAGINEKERLKSLFRLLEAKLCEHDEAEAARFADLFERAFRGSR